MDEQALTERLIAYDTSTPAGVTSAAEFVRGWLEARDIRVEELDLRGHAGAGFLGRRRAAARPSILHGHIDVVPGREEQFSPRVDGDRLYGRGAYDMKGGLAAMMGAVQELKDQRDVRVVLVVVPDEESEEDVDRATDIWSPTATPATSRSPASPPTSTSASRPRACWRCDWRSPARPRTARRPWLGDNAVLKALDTFRAIESLPFTRESSDLFDRPSINLGRIVGGDAHNKVPDSCVIDVEIRYLPGQDPGEILEQVDGAAGRRASSSTSPACRRSSTATIPS